MGIQHLLEWVALRTRSRRCRSGSRLFRQQQSSLAASLRARRVFFEPLEDRCVLATITVTTLANDTLANSAGDGEISLREAIEAANTNQSVDGSLSGDGGADTITFASSLTAAGGATIRLGGAELEITETLTITGPGRELLAIDAGGQSRVINFSAETGDLTLVGLTIRGGKTTGDNAVHETTHGGGGIRSESTGVLTIENSTVSGISTMGDDADGGGIWAFDPVTLTNSTVFANSTTGRNADGGGVFFESSDDFTVTNSILAGNTANLGRGPDFLPDPDSVLAVSHSLIGNNADTGLVEAPIGSAGPNLIGDPTNGIIDPLLGQLADNGGPTKTHALLLGSPAIDAGSNTLAVAADNSPLTTDQRGSSFARTLDGNGDSTATVDMGAFETPLISSSVDISGGDLVIADLRGIDSTLTIQSDTTNNVFVISDPNNLLGFATSIDGATGHGSGAVTVPFAAVTGSQIIVNTLDGNDSLTVDFSLGHFSPDITYNGGDTGDPHGDDLVLEGGGTFALAEYNFANATDGRIDITGNASITYSGLEQPITSTINATDVTLNYSAAAETITVAEAGHLTFVETKNEVSFGSRSVTTSPDGKHVYITSLSRNAVSILSRDAVTGRLTFVETIQDGDPGIDGLQEVRNVTTSPDGNHVYVASDYFRSRDDGAVTVFSRDAVTGRLTFVETIKDSDSGFEGLRGAYDVTTSPDGSHVYIASSSDAAVVVFSRDTETGRLAYVETIQDGDTGIDRLSGAQGITTSPDGNHVYLSSQFDGAVAVFSRDAMTGRLTFVEAIQDTDAGIDGLDGARDVTTSRDGKHVYVATGFPDNAVTVFSRDSVTGRLTFVETLKDTDRGIDGLHGARDVTASPDGKHVYIASSLEEAMAVFSRDAATGRLTFVETIQDSDAGIDGLDGITTSPDGNDVYITSFSGAVAVLRRNAIVRQQTQVTSTAGESLTFVNPDDTLTINAGDTGNDTIHINSLDADHPAKIVINGQGGDDQLTIDFSAGVFSSPIEYDGGDAGESSGDGLVLQGGGTFASAEYNFANATGGNLDISGNASITYTGLEQPMTSTVDATDVTLNYSAADETITVTDASVTGTGRLTFVETIKDGDAGIDGLDWASAITTSPDGKHVYVAGFSDNAVAVFRLDAGTSRLTFVEAIKKDDAGIDELNGPLVITTSADGKHVYVATSSNNTVVVFSRDAGTGRLTFFETIQASSVRGSGGSRGLTTSRDGKYVYITSSLGETVTVFSRDAETGRLTIVETIQDGDAGIDGLDGASRIATSPDENHVYIASGIADNAVTVFSRDAGTGRLTFVETLKDGNAGVDGLWAASGITTSPDGKHVYVSSIFDNAVTAFSRDAGTGRLTFVETIQDRDRLDGAYDVTTSRDGSHVYVASFFSKAVAVFSRDAATGRLTLVETIQDSDAGIDGLDGARAVTTSADGNLVYIASSADRAVAVFRRDDGARTAVTSTAGQSVTFDNPLGSLTINAGSGNDTVTITSVDSDDPFEAALTINGDAGNDIVNLNADLTFADGKHLDVDLTDDMEVGDIDQINLGANANVQTSGSSAVTLKASRSIVLPGGSSIRTLDGGITLEANQQAPAIGGDFDGIDARGATLQSDGAGNILLKGRAGDDATADSQIGVNLSNGTVVRSTKAAADAGTITINGAGGNGNDDNHGVQILDANSLVTSTAGDIRIIGTGGDGSETFNNGVNLDSGAKILSTGTDVEAATITITGTGGSGTSANDGVRLRSHSRVAAVAGNIRITGTGGHGSSSANDGVHIGSSAQVSSSGTGASAGTIAVSGRGGDGTSSNYGVRIIANGVITSVDGDIRITGTGGDGSAGFNIGVSLRTNAVVSSTGTGAESATITIDGTGGNGTFHNAGVGIFTRSHVTSAEGDIRITGAGNGSEKSNDGVDLHSGGKVSSTGTGANAATIAIDGTGGNGTFSNFGVYMRGIDSMVTSADGDIEITGTGGAGSMSANIGVIVQGSRINSTGTGADAATITIDGSGGDGPDNTSNVGVSLQNINSESGAVVSSANGDILIAGRTPSGRAIGVSTLLTTISGDIALVGDKIAASFMTVAAGSNSTVTLRPETDGTEIDYGNSNSDKLGLSSRGIEQINAGTIRIGDLDSGEITVSSPLRRSAATELELLTSGDVRFAENSSLTVEIGSQPLRVTGGLVFDPGVEFAVSNTPDIGTYTIIENDGSDDVLGTFAGLPEGAIIFDVGGSGLIAEITYAGGDGNDVVLMVGNLDPVITWDNPADITVGTLLSDTQLNATADVEGSFEYTPAAGEQLSVGANQQLSVTFTPTDTVNFNTVVRNVAINVLAPNLDFGDAPGEYPVTLGQDGARHAPGSLFLGSMSDAEADGQPSADAAGDANDEDGVFFVASMVAASGKATRSSVAVTSSGAGKLDAWIDFNQDGDWSDAGEKIFTSHDVTSGVNLLNFHVPSGAKPGTTVARFRLSSAGGLAPTGAAADGEVEDYLVAVLDGGPAARTAIRVDSPAPGTVDIVADGIDLVVRRGSLEVFRAPGDSLNELGIVGSESDDTVNVANLSEVFNGLVGGSAGAGNDTLRLTGMGHDLDLTQVADASLQGFEAIDITGDGDNTLTLDASEVINLSPTTDILRVRHNVGDVVNYRGDWSVELPQIMGGQYVHILMQDGATIEVANTVAFQNPLLSLDVNRDRNVSPVDALIVINRLNTAGPAELRTPTSIGNPTEFFYLDTNGDRFLAPIDVIRIMNFLNDPVSNPEGESAVSQVAFRAFDGTSNLPDIPAAGQHDNSRALHYSAKLAVGLASAKEYPQPAPSCMTRLVKGSEDEDLVTAVDAFFGDFNFDTL